MRQRLGDHVRAHRRSQGLTQEQLADQLGVTARYFAGIERGEYNLTLDTVDSLAKQLNVGDALELLAGPLPEG